MNHQRGESHDSIMEIDCQAIPCSFWDCPTSVEDLGATSPGDVVFPPARYRVFDRDRLAFPAEYRGRYLRCVISWQVLAARFRARIHSRQEAEQVFSSNQPKIEKWVRRLIQEGRVTADYEVLIQ
jgi:hypothetical protein